VDTILSLKTLVGGVPVNLRDGVTVGSTPSVPVLLTPIVGAVGVGYPITFNGTLVLFTWTSIDNTDKGYEIQVDDNADMSSPEIDATWTCPLFVCTDNDRKYEATSEQLKPSTKYYWRVRALR
jgi:hypothetical protein